MARVLLDEGVPEKLRHALSGHDVRTVRYMGWRGCKNGELLRRAGREGFDVVIALDKNIASQQNLTGRLLEVVIIQSRDEMKPSTDCASWRH